MDSIRSRKRRSRENIVHVAEAQRAVFDEPQARVAEQGDEVLRGNAAMAAMKMFGQPWSLPGFPRKIYGQNASTGFQDSTHLGSALLPRFARQVMEHHRGDYRVELSVGKR